MLLLFSLLAGIASSVACQGQGAFSWTASQEPVQCQPLTLGCIVPPGVSPQPPFTLHIFPVQGRPFTQELATRYDNTWTWVPTLPAGTKAFLLITDANGLSGGTSDLITVGASADTSCLDLAPPSAPIQLTLNTTALAPPCNAVRISLTGGTRPYTVTAVRDFNATFANTTLNADQDEIVFIDPTINQPGTLLLSARDSAGNVATSSAISTSSSSTTATCPLAAGWAPPPPTAPESALTPGASGDATATTSEEETNEDNGGGGMSVGARAAISVGISILSLALLGFLFFLLSRYIRRRRQARENKVENKELFGDFVFTPAPPANATPGRFGQEEMADAPCSPYSPAALLAIVSPRGRTSLISPRSPEPRPPAYDAPPLTPASSRQPEIGKSPRSPRSPLPFSNLVTYRRKSTLKYSPSSQRQTLLSRFSPRKNNTPTIDPYTPTAPLSTRRRPPSQRTAVPTWPRSETEEELASDIAEPGSPQRQIDSYTAHAAAYASAFQPLGPPRRPPAPPSQDYAPLSRIDDEQEEQDGTPRRRNVTGGRQASFYCEDVFGTAERYCGR